MGKCIFFFIFILYYFQADLNKTGCIGSVEAANYLRKSGLPQNTLSKVCMSRIKFLFPLFL